jgi:membrane fusion protein (multidrug efflux system)
MRVTLRSCKWPPALALALLAALAGCEKKETARAAPPPVEVAALTVHPALVPIAFEFVGQTESSQQVEIRARVDGFLEKRQYVEGSVVKPGQTLFVMDRKPFEAQLQASRAELEQEQARLATANANLARVKPLAAQNALSQKDLDDAVGAQQSAAAAVEAADAKVTNAKLNLGYTTISSPLAGLSSFAKVQDGAYVNPQNNLLTYVARLDPMRVNFSISENELLRAKEEISRRNLQAADRDDYVVEVQLADGSIFPYRGRITFADASFNQETGTFLIRAEIPNPRSELRPGQFVRARVLGFTRPNAIIVPQRAILTGPRGQYVWVVGKDGKAEARNVEAGDWLGDNWLVSSGLNDGDRVVVEGVIRVAPGAPLKVADAPPIKIPTLASKLAASAPGADAAPLPSGSASPLPGGPASGQTSDAGSAGATTVATAAPTGRSKKSHHLAPKEARR